MAKATETEERDWSLDLHGGKTTADGKSHWPDMVRVNIPDDRIFDTAMRLLRVYEDRRLHPDSQPYELALFGKLELKAQDQEPPTRLGDFRKKP